MKGYKIDVKVGSYRTEVWTHGYSEEDAMFCMSEMYTGTFTTQYARCNGKYYCKMVDCADKSTWIHNLLK